MVEGAGYRTNQSYITEIIQFQPLSRDINPSEIAQLHTESGLSCAQIAAQIGCSKTHVITSLKRMGSAVTLSAHRPPSGPSFDLYVKYVESDFKNPVFINRFLDTFEKDESFARRIVQFDGNYGGTTGRQIWEAITADKQLGTELFELPSSGDIMNSVGSHKERQGTLRSLMFEASMQMTNAILVSESTGLTPVTDSSSFSSLLAIRLEGESIGTKAAKTLKPRVGLEIARAVIPDKALAELSIAEILDYRKMATQAYSAWSVEIDSLAHKVAEMNVQEIEKHLETIVATEIRPKLLAHRNEMESIRDKMFGDLMKKVLLLEFPAISLAVMANSDLRTILTTFAAALSPALTSVVDYLVAARAVNRNNSMAYLIGIAPTDK